MALFNSSMEKNIIKAPQGTNYLSDIISELPVNCLFNKGKTGCGGTELVLRGTKNAIIAVPYISLIQNKLDANSEHGDRRDEILGFYGEVDETEVRAYLSTHSLKKIIVTYDSLPKLVRIIGEVEGDGEKGFNDYFLLYSRCLSINRVVGNYILLLCGLLFCCEFSDDYICA